MEVLTIPKALKQGQFSFEFVQKMISRMTFGQFRYGPIRKKRGEILSKWFSDKLKRYRETGNRELLVDMANYCMSEYMYPEHSRACYVDEDQGGHQQLTVIGHFHRGD